MTEGVDGRVSRGLDSSAPQTQLEGKLGTTSVVLSVLGFLAPLGAAAGYVPLVVGYGNGLGAPLTFLLCGFIILMFSFGFMALVRHVPRPGAYYAYISAGLGRRFGLAAAVVTIVLYFYGLIGFSVFGGLAANSVVNQHFGLDLPWWSYVLLNVVIVGFCSYREIGLSARVLTVIVAVEIAVILLFAVVTLLRGGPTGRPLEPFTVDAFTGGSLAVAILFAMTMFFCFESTAIYRDEASTPERTIPRATYIVIAATASFYAFTVWALIAALGTDNAVTETAADPAGSFTKAITTTLGQTFSDMVAALILTSVLASQLAGANVISRYLHSFAVDTVLPHSLSVVHRKYGSPHRAAIVTSTAWTAAILIIVLAGTDPVVVYGAFGGVGSYAFLALLLCVSLAAVRYFWRTKGHGEPAWKVYVAPIASVLVFGWLLYFSAARFDLLLGKPTSLTWLLLAAFGVAFFVGLGFASWLAWREPQRFAKIGRAEG